MVRTLSYAQAINEALRQMMERDEKVILLGQGVTSPWYVGTTTVGLIDQFGGERVIETPVSESCVTGAAIGAALAGWRPIVVHPRMDFMYYAMDQIGNHAANWYYMFGGKQSVPVTLWAIINRGGEQAAQHSQAIQAMFVHIPGLKVVMPSTPNDAKGLLISAVRDLNPVVFVDDRWLYTIEGDVCEDMFEVPIGKGVVRREGRDVTIAATSYMVCQAVKAADILEQEGLDAEVVDLRSLKPLDEDLLLSSVRKTGRIVVVDGAWRSCGFGAEICARVGEGAWEHLKSGIARVTLPDSPAPASSALEEIYYVGATEIAAAVRKVVGEARGNN